MNDDKLIGAARDLVQSVDEYEEVIVNSVRYSAGAIEKCFSSLLEYRDKLRGVIAVREARGDDAVQPKGWALL